MSLPQRTIEWVAKDAARLHRNASLTMGTIALLLFALSYLSREE